MEVAMNRIVCSSLLVVAVGAACKGTSKHEETAAPTASPVEVTPTPTPTPAPATATAPAPAPAAAVIKITNREELDAAITWVDYPKPQNMPQTVYAVPKSATACVELGPDVVTGTKREDLDVDGDGTTDVIHRLDHTKLVDGSEDPIGASIILARKGPCMQIQGMAPVEPAKLKLLGAGSLEAQDDGYIYKLTLTGGTWQATEIRVETNGKYGRWMPAKDFVAQGDDVGDEE
jgi:hypothetical protein